MPRSGTGLFCLALLAGAAPAAAQDPAVSAAPPAGVTVYTVTGADWKDVMCLGDSVAMRLPAGQWIALPFGWYAKDEATARDNWKHMKLELLVDDKPIALPADAKWRTAPVDVQCPDRRITGVSIAPVLYLPPLAGPRKITGTFTFSADVNDGWNAFPKGTASPYAVMLRPRPAEAPAGQPTAEPMLSRLRYQWWALMMASVTNARAHGQSPADLGASLGRLFASSWGQDVTPQSLARGMSSNFRNAGLETELLEDTPQKAVLRYSQPDAGTFAKQYGEWGVTVEDYQATMIPLVRAIAAAHGLIWDVGRDGDRYVATVTRKQ